MSDVNANIGVHIDTSAALAELKNLQRQIATFHSQISKSSAAAAMAQKNLQTNLLNSVNATGQFRASMGVVKTSTESFTSALEKNKLSMKDYFRFAGGASRSFGKLFKSEFDTIGKVAEERVKKMQTQYIKMGRDANGAMRAMAITPNTLNMQDYATKTAMAAQKQALFNQLVKQGSTNLLNFGKNTQWAGRQLMVGFSVPLMYIGAAAGKVFMDMETQALKFKRVYGDMFTTTDETTNALKDIELLAKEFTKYGVAVTKTMEMAADAAAMGQTGAALTAQVAQATRLAVLGNVEQQQALETTISLTSAFGIAAEDLASKIDFLNSVENQTIVSIEDLTIAVPKAGPVVKQLGGDVEDLAFFLTAMKEGGINASEGANALKSGLASLINPTKKAAEMLNGYGVNIKAIVEGNQGDIKSTVIEFAQALDTLAPLDRSRAIEQLFGKFQFARLSTLFQNITKEGTQANRVLELSKMEVEELAILSERELKTIENAVGTNFKEAVESLKLTIAPIGKTFLEAVTPIVKAVAGILEKFNGLSDGTKKFIVIASTLVGIIGPTLLMTFGLVANGAANIIKLFLALRTGFLRLGGNTKVLAEQTSYMNSEQLEAATVAASLNQAHTRLTQSFTLETSAVKALRAAYVEATVAAANFARANPGMMMPGGKGGAPKKFARGATYVPGTGNKDTVPSVLTPGEAVIPKDVAQDPRFQPIIDAMVNGNLQAFETGSTGVSARKSKALKRYVDLKYGAETGVNTEAQQAYKSNRAGYQELLSRITYDEKTNKYVLHDKAGNPKSTFNEKQLKQQLAYSFREAPNAFGQMSSRSINPSILDRYLGRVGKAGTGAPQSVRRVREGLNKQFVDKEGPLLRAELEKAGLSQKEIQNFMGKKEESHIIKPKVASKKWDSGFTISDHAGVNNYLNRAGNVSVGKMVNDPRLLLSREEGGLGLTSRQVAELKKDYSFAQSQKHPTNAAEFSRIARLAALEVSMSDAKLAKVEKISQAKGIVALSKIRTPASYKDIAKTIIKLGPKPRALMGSAEAIVLAKGEDYQTKTGKDKTVTGQTGTAKPSGKNITDSPRDTRIVNKKSIKRVFPYGMKGPRIAGAITGYDEDATGKTAVGPRGLIARNQQRTKDIKSQEAALKEQTAATKESTEATKKNATETTASSKETKLSKESIKNFAGKANIGVGALSGLTIAASFAGGKVGEMAQKIMPFIFGLQGVLMLLPLLMNPLVGIPLAIGAVVAGIWLFKKKQDEAVKAQARLVDDLYATTKKMQEVGEISGKVGASQLMERKRESGKGDFSFERKGIKFGSAFLQSEVGKADIAAFETRFKAMPDIAMREFSLKLASYVSDGVIDAAQAASIADQVGIQFQDKVLGIKIQGQLERLITLDGKDLTTEPFEIRIKIAEETVNQFNNLAGDLQGQLSGAEANVKLKQKALDALTQSGVTVKQPISVRQGIEDEIKAAKERVDYVKNAMKQNAAFASGLASQAYEGIQAQIDATEVYASKKLDTLRAEKAATKDLSKQQEIQKQIDLIESKRLSSINKLRSMNNNVTEGIERQFKLFTNMDKANYFTGSSEAVRTRFKGTKQEGDANMLLAKTGQMGDTVFRAKIEATVSSGQLAPGQATSFIDLFAGDQKTLEKTFNTYLTVQGLEDLNKLQSILGGFEDQELAKKIMVDMSGLSDAEFQAQYSTLELLQQMDNEEINIELILKDPGALAKITKVNTAIEKIPDVTEKNVIATLQTVGFKDENALKTISENWEYFAGLPSDLRKTALQTFTTLHSTIFANKESKMEWARSYAESMTPNLRKQNREEAVTRVLTTIIDTKTGEFTDKGSKAAKEDVFKQMKDIIGIQQMYDKMVNKAKSGGGIGGGTEATTALDTLINKLRLTRDAAIDAEGGLTTLMGLLGGKKQLTLFEGLEQELARLKAPDEFIEFISNLDPKLKKGKEEALATYVNIKKLKQGFMELTPEGEAALKAIREIGVGEFESDLRRQTNELIAQKEQFIKLNLILNDTEKTTEFLSDAQFALNFQLATNAAEALTVVKAFEKLKQIELDLANVKLTPLQQLTNEAEKLTEEFEKQYAVQMESLRIQEEQARIEFQPGIQKAQDKVDEIEAAIQKINDEIDQLQDNISDKQHEIEMTVDRPIELLQASIESLQTQMENQIDKPISDLQDSISAMQRNIEMQFDRPLAALSDESEVLSNNLTLIQKQEDTINDQFDKQRTALEQINKLNQDAVSLNKTKLGLAEALSQGDISAAASAIQDMRAQEAALSANAQQTALEDARKNALGQVKVGGLTREQIEERQFQIGQESYRLQQARALVEAQILKVQDQIYTIEQGRVLIQNQINAINALIALKEIDRKRILAEIRIIEDAIYAKQVLGDESLRAKNIKLAEANVKLKEAEKFLTDALKNIEDQKKAWDADKLAIDAAKSAADLLNGSLTTTLGLVQAIVAAWAAVAGQKAADQAAADKAAADKAAADKAAADAAKTDQTAKTQAEVDALIAARKDMPISGPNDPRVEYGGQRIDSAGNYNSYNAEMAYAMGAGRYATPAPVVVSPEQEFRNKYGSIYKASGGMIPKYFAAGGYALGTDTVPAMLTPGEFVMSKYAVSKYGIDKMKDINNGTFSGSSVYNYSVNVNVDGTSANPQDIARYVIKEIKGLEAQKIRGYRK